MDERYPLWLKRLGHCVKEAFPKGMKTAWWLLKITIPVSFGVLLLDYYGLLDLMAKYTGPVFQVIGLPGVSAIVLITSIFTNIYSVVAVLSTLNLPMREGIIIATMCLVSHGFIIETAVLRKTGSSAVRMLLLRIISSFIIGWLLNMMMPGQTNPDTISVARIHNGFQEVFMLWLKTISATTLKILVLVNLLLILQKVMEEFGLIKWLERPLRPLMKVFGLPEKTTFSWIVANAIGLAYGSAIMINLTDEGKLGRNDADLLNHHIAVSHSQLEDPLLFLTLGYTIHWLIWPRVLIAMAAVWLRRAELRFIPASTRARQRLPEGHRTVS